MKFTRIELDTTELKSFANAISQKMKKSYVNQSDNLIIVADESYKLRTNSTQMNMVIIKKTESKLIVDIIGAAGGTGVFNFSLWSESGFVKDRIKVLEKYCTENSIKIVSKLTKDNSPF